MQPNFQFPQPCLPSLRSVIVWGILCLQPLSLHAADILELSIPEFVAKQREWSKWEGRLLRLEGRDSSLTPSAMRFQKCNLTFYLPERVQRPPSREQTVEVTGRLKREKGELSFYVDSLHVRPSDQDQLQLKKRALPAKQPAAWYQLGQQTIQRGQFYDDLPLRRQGEAILWDGLQLEKQLQPTLTPLFLQELAAKAAQFELPARLRLELLHESFQLAAVEAQKPAQFTALREQLAQGLPGSQITLKSSDEKLIKQYEKAPLVTFQAASESVRQQLARLFYLQVLRQEYQQKLTQTPAQGERLVEEFRKLAPDDAATAQELKQAALKYLTKHLTTTSRNDVLKLAQEYREQKQPEKADEVLKSWIAHREEQLVRAGPSDFLQTAQDHLDWFNNTAAAEAILLRGIAKFPENLPLQAQLRRRQYALHEGKWLPQADIPTKPMSAIEQAAQSGRIVPGMTREQVVSSLGAPQSFSHIASPKGTLLIWNFPDARLAIRFEHRPDRKDYIVSQVSPLEKVLGR